MVAIFIVAGLLAVAVLLWYVEKSNRARLAAMTPEERRRLDAEMDALSTAREEATQARIAAAGSRSQSARSLLRNEARTSGEASTSCPRCGDTAARRRRSPMSVASGLVGAAPPDAGQVRCRTCGATYTRR
jgi:uncharacterized paraquat-inducible protein A